MATYQELVADYNKLWGRVNKGKTLDRDDAERYRQLRTDLAGQSYLPDVASFDPAGFDPSLLSSDLGEAVRREKDPTKAREAIYKAVGATQFDPNALSEQGLKAAQDAYAQAEGQLAGALAGKATRLGDLIYARNVVFSDYANLSKQYANALAAKSQADIQTSRLQEKQKARMIEATQNQFFDLPEGEADVRIGSNIADRRTKRRASTSTPSSSARSKVVVRAPGINI